MKARDRFEELTKEGCARVCVHKSANIPHSYTLECGFHLIEDPVSVLPEASN
jgi:cytosolic carboxypeptidase protein 5